jgi:hypothetical protein
MQETEGLPEDSAACLISFPTTPTETYLKEVTGVYLSSPSVSVFYRGEKMPVSASAHSQAPSALIPQIFFSWEGKLLTQLKKLSLEQT